MRLENRLSLLFRPSPISLIYLPSCSASCLSLRISYSSSWKAFGSITGITVWLDDFTVGWTCCKKESNYYFIFCSLSSMESSCCSWMCTISYSTLSILRSMTSIIFSSISTVSSRNTVIRLSSFRSTTYSLLSNASTLDRISSIPPSCIFISSSTLIRAYISSNAYRVCGGTICWIIVLVLDNVSCMARS